MRLAGHGATLNFLYMIAFFYKNAIPYICAIPEEETKSLSDLRIAHLLLTGEVPDPEIDACDQTKND